MKIRNEYFDPKVMQKPYIEHLRAKTHQEEVVFTFSQPFFYLFLGECRGHFEFPLLNVVVSIIYYWSIMAIFHM